VLRFTDAAGAQHEVVATDGYDRSRSTAATEGVRPYREHIPLLGWNVVFEGAATRPWARCWRTSRRGN
jgi:hypothetical protein